VLEVSVHGSLDTRGVVMDFAEVDAIVDKCVLSGDRGLDHRDLNTILENPTAELVAIMIGERLTAGGLPWSTIRLWETADGSVLIQRP
jgi:6-pyruvoyl-tetrahydropterin synthase